METIYSNYYIYIVLFFSLSVYAEDSENLLSFDLLQSHNVSSDTTFFRSNQVPDNNTILNVHLNSQKKLNNNKGTFKIDGHYIYSDGEKSHYANLTEMYYEKEWDHWSVALGQHLYSWSRGDQVWNRGLWQPRFFWDKLSPVEQGLTGLHLSYKRKNHYFRLFVSGIHIPELGPKFEVNANGQMTSANPWFRPPPSSVEMLSQTVTNNYIYEKPEIEDILLKESIAFLWEWKNEEYFLSFSYAHKPMNQVVVSSSSIFDAFNSRLDMAIYPETLYHNISTLEAGKQGSGPWSYWASITLDEPNKNNKPTTWVSQQQDDAVVSTLYVDYSLSEVSKYSSKVFVSYSYVDGGDAKDSGDNALNTSYYEKRFQYTNSVRVGLDYKASQLYQRPLFTKTEIIYDIDQNGAVFSMDLGWQYKKNISLKMSADFLGLVSSKEASRDGGVISDYRANDRISLGVSYVF